jgi:membrane-associated phospholipid phosphatase
LHAIWLFVTDCGDSAVTVPLALLTLVFLIGAGARRIARGWVLAIGGCAVAIALLKLVFGACGQRIPLGHIVSPSGHTAMSTAIYGSLSLLVAAGLAPRRRIAVYAAASVAIIGIALSRVVLHEHNLPEVATGWVVGAGAIAFFRSSLRPENIPAVPLGWLLLCGVLLIAVMHGTRWMIEPAVHRLAWDFRLALPWCQ